MPTTQPAAQYEDRRHCRLLHERPLCRQRRDAFPDRVKAAASIYGTHLATDQPDSPHLAAAKTKAELYFACAETDVYAPQEIIEKVKQGMKGDGPRPRSRSIPARITASPSRSARSTTATPPSGTGNGCWRSTAATSPFKGMQ